MDKIKILVVDDHAIVRDCIRALLNLYDDIEIVGEASEGQESIQKAIALSPDVILMDIIMPGMDGLKATRCMIERKLTAKVLVLTQYDDKEYILSAIKAGAVGYLPKKAASSELVSAIRTVYGEGSFLHPAAAKALIEDYQQPPAREDTYDRLTLREKEILKLIIDGHSSREIGERLSIRLKTVLSHRAKIMQKLNIHNRTALIKYAIRRGLVSIGT